MKNLILVCIPMLLLVGCSSSHKSGPLAQSPEPLLAVSSDVAHYANTTIAPRLNEQHDQDTLAQLLLVSKTLTDSQDGVSVNRVDPGRFMVYHALRKVGLGGLSTIGLSPVQKRIIRDWHKKYMHADPADVFFAPSAGEIIGSRAAFGCTHYARSFIATVKTLGLISRHEDLRYVISSKADDYNSALKKQDFDATINGHQFAIVRIDSQWIAINTSTGMSTPLPAGFDPDAVAPPHNIPIRFPTRPHVVYVLRRIGTDWDDGCGDRSLTALMNISRSGSPDNSAFLWEAFTFEKGDVYSD